MTEQKSEASFYNRHKIFRQYTFVFPGIEFPSRRNNRQSFPVGISRDQTSENDNKEVAFPNDTVNCLSILAQIARELCSEEHSGNISFLFPRSYYS